MKGVRFTLLLALALIAGSAFAQSPPANDDFNSSITIPSALDSPFSYAEDVTNATWASDDPTPDYWNRTVWFSFTPSATIPIRISTEGSSYDTSLFLFTGTRGAFTQLFENDDFLWGKQSQMNVSLDAGRTYYFVIASFAYEYGATYNLNVVVSKLTPPDNDSIETPRVIGSALPSTTTEYTDYATTSVNDPNTCEYFWPGPTVWFTYTPTADVHVYADTSTSDYWAELVVVTRNADGSLTKVTDCTNTFEAHAGVTYYIMVNSAYGTPGSNLNLVLREYQPLEYTVHFDSATLDVFSGTLRISVTVTCTQQTSFAFFGDIRQMVGRVVLWRHFWEGPPECRPDAPSKFQFEAEAPWQQVSQFRGRSSLLPHPGKLYITGQIWGWSYEIPYQGYFDFNQPVLVKPAKSR